MLKISNTIHDFFKRKDAQSSNVYVSDTLSPTSNIPISENFIKDFKELMTMNLILIH